MATEKKKITKPPMMKKTSKISPAVKEDTRPSISISESQLPEMKDWELKNKYKVKIEIEMISHEISEWGYDKGKIIGRFRINSIKPCDDDSEKEKGESSSKKKSEKSEEKSEK